MNHSCEPNTEVGAADDSPPGLLVYHVFAARDVAEGEELTCDYTLAEWDAREKGIEACRCGSDRCLGRVDGFKVSLGDRGMCAFVGGLRLYVLPCRGSFYPPRLSGRGCRGVRSTSSVSTRRSIRRAQGPSRELRRVARPGA
jgi:hypothetical protein